MSNSSVLQEILQLTHSGRIGESLAKLQNSIHSLDASELTFLLDSPIVSIVLDHFINLKKKGALEKVSSIQKQECFQVMHLLDCYFSMDSTNQTQKIRSSLQEFLCSMASVAAVSESAFQILSKVATKVPEIFSKQVTQRLQRSLIEKCDSPSLRLEYFLRVFHNLRTHSSKQIIDMFFYVSLLQIQCGSSSTTRLTRLSVIMILQTLQYLLKESEDEKAPKAIFAVFSQCLFPKICQEYSIMGSNGSINLDKEVQIETFLLLKIWINMEFQPLISFTAIQIPYFKQLLSKKQNPLVLITTLDLLKLCSQSDEQASIDMIDHLLEWDQFQSIIDKLTQQHHKFNKRVDYVNKRISEAVCDLLLSLIGKDVDKITDHFINEYLIGQTAELCDLLDSKRRIKGTQMLTNVLRYLFAVPFTKFSTEEDEFEQQSSDNSIEESQYSLGKYGYQKLMLRSVSDILEVAAFPYEISKVTPLFYAKMQDLGIKVRKRLIQKFAQRFPNSLSSSFPKSQNKAENESESEWEDEQTQDEGEQSRSFSQQDIYELVQGLFNP